MEDDWEKERKWFSQEIVSGLRGEDRNREESEVSRRGVETRAIRTAGGQAGQMTDRTGDQ